MKTIEQKAKAYDEALEKARQLCNYPTSKSFVSDLQDLFPELKESEDEKIIKWLIEFVNQYGDKFYGQIAKASVIAWLEKQEVDCTKLELKAGNSYFCYRSRWERADSVTFKKGLIYKCNKDGVLNNFVIENPEQHFIEIKDEQKVTYNTLVNVGDGGMNALVTKELPIDILDEDQNPDAVEPTFKVGDCI